MVEGKEKQMKDDCAGPPGVYSMAVVSTLVLPLLFLLLLLQQQRSSGSSSSSSTSVTPAATEY